MEVQVRVKSDVDLVLSRPVTLGPAVYGDDLYSNQLTELGK